MIKCLLFFSFIYVSSVDLKKLKLFNELKKQAKMTVAYKEKEEVIVHLDFLKRTLDVHDNKLKLLINRQIKILNKELGENKDSSHKKGHLGVDLKKSKEQVPAEKLNRMEALDLGDSVETAQQNELQDLIMQFRLTKNS